MPAYDYPLLIKQLLLTPLARHVPSKIAFRDVWSYDYPTFRQRIGRLGSALASLGIAHGDTVAVMDWDTPRYLETYFAVPMSGATLQTVNVRLSPEQIVYTLNHAAARVVICNVDFAPLLESIRGSLTTVDKIVWATDAATPGHPAAIASELRGDGEYEALLAAGDPACVFPDFDENTRATIFYTTGTTGLPKGVSFTHRQLVLHTLAGCTSLGVTAESRYMPMTPMFHVHAWGVPYMMTMMGCNQIYPGRYLPDVLLSLIGKERITFSHGVPTLVQMILNAPGSADVDMRGMRVVIGGSALPRALCEAGLARGLDIVGGYGMSETCPLVSVTQVNADRIASHDEEVRLRMKAGMAGPLVDLRVVDEEMHDLPHDGKSAGEIVVRAPWLTRGYHGNPEATEALWFGGYLHTQDIGTIDPSGYLTITDRIKDVIKTGGEWVSSLDLESLIGQCPGIAECAVIGVPDAKWGERPLAICSLKPGAGATAEQIKAFVLEHAERGTVSKFAVPGSVHFVDVIDKTSVGKLDKKALRAKFAPAGTTGAASMELTAPASGASR